MSHLVSSHFGSIHLISSHFQFISRLSSSHLISVYLISYPVTSHLASSQLVSSHPSSSHHVSIRLVSSHFVSLHLISSICHTLSCLISSLFVSSRLVSPTQDGRSIEPTPLGRISSFYYISHKTIQLFHEKLKPDMTLEALMELMTEVGEAETRRLTLSQSFLFLFSCCHVLFLFLCLGVCLCASYT